VALLAEQVPEDGRRRLRTQLEVHRGRTGQELLVRLAGLGDAGEVALHVGGEHRHAGVGQPLGEDLQGDGLAGACGASHQPVAVGPVEPEELGSLRLADQHTVFTHLESLS
jgi:hypothetical protein